ncbi:hypothetical protein [Sphingobacterium thalpophilum]|uniref:hypothetical protein n=1 Tax=Sphingobacterium thalpophilum TaxID=259 RepID=UPI003C7272B5
MFEKFQKAVREAYLDLKENRKLDFSREWPSTGDLKNWSIQCFEKGLTIEDEVVYKDFFSEKVEKKKQKQIGKSLREIVREAETDKFRALRNFIIGDTKRSPERDVVKFLAVLVDFQQRPYNFDYWQAYQTDNASTISGTPENRALQNTDRDRSNSSKYNSDSDISNKDYPDENTITNVSDTGVKHVGITDGQGDSKEKNGDKNNASERIDSPTNGLQYRPVNNQRPSNEKQQNITSTFFRNNKYILRFSGATLLVLAILVTVYYLTPTECMCWNGERYLKEDCQAENTPSQVVGFNKNKFDNFFKIMRPDTLNEKHVGTVWYSKIDNKVEFFTGPGFHPTETKKGLKLATLYIIETYGGKNAERIDP